MGDIDLWGFEGTPTLMERRELMGEDLGIVLELLTKVDDLGDSELDLSDIELQRKARYGLLWFKTSYKRLSTNKCVSLGGEK
jgi:hypothetical protein